MTFAAWWVLSSALWLTGAVPGETAVVEAPPWQPPPRLVDWARARIPRRGPDLHRLRLLRDALVTPHGLGLREVSGASGNAFEVLERRRADCVGFAYLLGGLARSLGLETLFVAAAPAAEARPVEKTDLPASARGLKVAEAHLAVGLRGPDGALWVADFSGLRPDTSKDFVELADAEAAALLWANRGAKALLAGRCDEALRYSSRAASKAPRLLPLTRNLRLVERRCGAPAR